MVASNLRRNSMHLLLIVICAFAIGAHDVYSAPWFSSFNGASEDTRSEEDLSNLVSPIINRELEASVVAHSWPSNPQSVFCEAFAYHATNFHNDDSPRKGWTSEEEESAVALNHAFLNSLSDQLLHGNVDDNNNNNNSALPFRSYETAKAFVVEASAQLTPSSKALLEYSLAMRVYSPQCELHRGLARQTLKQLRALASFGNHNNLFAVAYPAGNLVLKEQLANADWASFSRDDVGMDGDDGDLLLPGEVPFGKRTDDGNHSDSVQQLVILYANIGTVEFAKAYKKLQQDANHKNIRFVVRHLGAIHYEEVGPDSVNSPTILQGYGVRLDIRNVEYKVFDDRKTDANLSEDETGLMNLTTMDDLRAPLQFIAGVNFSALGLSSGGKSGTDDRNSSELLKALWKKHEIQQRQLIPPTWQRRKLPLQAASAVAASKDPLMTLEEVSLNLPSVASTLVHVKIPQELEEIAEKLEQDLKEARSSPGVLLINGRHVSIDRPTFNVFELLNVLRKEQAALESLQKELGPYLENPMALNKVKNAWSMGRDFLRAFGSKKGSKNPGDLDGEPETKASRIDVARGWKKAVMYLNDIEKDEKYAQWPRQVRQVFMAMQFGMPPSIRRNLFTILAVIDPTTDTQNVGMALGKQLMQSNYPARLGILIVGEEDVRACAEWVAANPLSDEGEACPVARGPVLDRAINLKEKDKLKGISGSARALHRLFADLFSKYPNDMIDAYLEFVVQTLETKKEVSNSGNISMYDIVEAHADALEGMQVGGGNAHWSDAMELLMESEEEDEDDTTRPQYTKALRFAVDKGLKAGMSFVNGRPLPKGSPNEVFEEAGSILNDELSYVFGLIQKGEIKDNTPKSVYGFFLSGKSVYKKVHPLLMDSRDKSESYVRVPHGFDSKSLLFPSATSDKNDAVFVVDALLDVSSSRGLHLAKSFVTVMNEFPGFIAESGDRNVNVKVGFRIVPSKASESSKALCPIFAKAGELGANALMTALETALSKYEAGFSTVDIMNSIPGLSDEMRRTMNTDVAEGHCSRLASFEAVTADNLIVSNGLYYDLNENSVTKDDVELLLSIDLDIATATRAYLSGHVSHDSAEGCDSISRIVAFLASEMASAQFDRVGLEEEIRGLEKAYGVEENPLRFAWNKRGNNDLELKVTAVVDPASELSQRLSPLLRVMRDTLKLPITLVLTPRTNLEADAKVPITSFYRFVADPKASQDERPPKAIFSNLPMEHTLTLRMDVPEPWDVQQSNVVQDTDNLRCDAHSGCSDEAHLGSQDESVALQDRDHITRAEYGLNSLLVFGQCYETQGATPNGLQLTLSRKEDQQTGVTSRVQDIELGMDGRMMDESQSSATLSEDEMTTRTTTPYSDTLVMKNVGYWQLRANPGVWNLQIAKGSKGAEIFDIVDGTVRRGKLKVLGRSGDNSTKPIVMKDFINRGELLLVERREGHEKTKLFSSDSLQKTDDGDKEDVINVFSLATGHLYERFLKIMMLSVTKRTSMKVKFWFFENFLSPSFKESSRYMAEKIGCEVAFVTYKWPEWLRGQSEKQRIIWGYKILFLDVLFPLSVKKIIYVDADQVVRADLRELWFLDLDGKPYGYTPMCSSRESTLGFQFWRGGFWESHLGGRPYHISALYVVDLEKFRKQLVGDQLRSIYQQLSADPNSLANLDQDLPNYAQHAVPIFSLPQEWLWCESWCSDETKATAKTIDLCNNPLHKEPKVSMAKRIISGPLFNESWVELDEEVEGYQKEWLETKTQ